jgi:hypothetical protein
VESFSDIPVYALSRSSPIAAKSCSNGNGTESCPASPFGTTSEPSTERHGEGGLMLCAEDSPAQTFHPPAPWLESQERKAAYGSKWPEWFAKFDPILSSWKILQISLFADLDESLETWPRWGIMHDGVCSELATLPLPTSESESGYWPTPTASDSIRMKLKRPSHEKNLANNKSKGHGAGLASSSLPAQLAVQIGAFLHPILGEWLMGFPMGWTDLNPLAMDKFQQWLDSHGKPSSEKYETNP